MAVAEKKEINLASATIIAEQLQERLQPYCKGEYCVIAGSIRRKKTYVGDIELVCIPRRATQVPAGEMFPKPDVNLLVHHLHTHHSDDSRGYVIKKGGERYHQIIFADIQCDIFMTTQTQWGRMLALRTGPATYSTKMAVRWNEKGFKGHKGELVHLDQEEHRYKPEFPTEKSFFDFLGWEYVKPEERN